MTDTPIFSADALAAFWRELIEGGVPPEVAHDLMRVAAPGALEGGLVVHNEHLAADRTAA